MGTEQLLVGNLAISAIVIKTIVSAIKQKAPLRPIYSQIATMLLGVASAFIFDVKLIEVIEPSTSALALQKVFAGLFIGASAMGVHETTKVMKTNAR